MYHKKRSQPWWVVVSQFGTEVACRTVEVCFERPDFAFDARVPTFVTPPEDVIAVVCNKIFDFFLNIAFPPIDPVGSFLFTNHGLGTTMPQHDLDRVLGVWPRHVTLDSRENTDGEVVFRQIDLVDDLTVTCRWNRVELGVFL